MPITLGLYDVVVMPTPAATRCQLETAKPDRYRLQFVDNGIVVKERLPSEPSHGSWRQVYHLRYDYIRRYGKRTNVFIIEAGRSCETGEGEFRFQSADADKMFNLFRGTTEDILNRQQKTADASPGNGSPEANNTPNHRLPENGTADNPLLSKGQLIENNNVQSKPPSSALLRSGSSSSGGGHPTVTKDDTHIYSQVQKKRMAPNIPPRGTSLRKPSGFATNGSMLSSSSRSADRTLSVGRAESNGSNNRKDSASSTPPRGEKREPIYTELMQTSNNNSMGVNGAANKNRTATKARCRSPAPLTDNFIRMEGYTQYATVVDFLPPQSTKLAQERQCASDSPSQSNNPQNHSEPPTENGQKAEPVSPVSSANQKKKAKTKNVKSDKKSKKQQQQNDENKQSSWLRFFSGGNKKTASS